MDQYGLHLQQLIAPNPPPLPRSRSEAERRNEKNMTRYREKLRSQDRRRLQRLKAEARDWAAESSTEAPPASTMSGAMVSENGELSDDASTMAQQNAPINDDETKEQIPQSSTSVMTPHNFQRALSNLRDNFNEEGLPEELVDLVISYILECPNSKTELTKRTECVAAVMKGWSDLGPLVLSAINAVLTAVEPLEWLQSRNLFDFINCCLDRNAFDGKDLRINENESTSLKAEHAKELRSRIYPTVMEALATASKKFLN